MLNSLRGDAPAVAQVVHLTPSNVGAGDLFRVLINRKAYAYTAADGDGVAQVVAGLVTAIAENVDRIAEFDEVVATEGSGFVILTAATPGRQFIVEVETENAEGGSSALIVETIKGVSPVNEQQTLALDGVYSGGTFVLENDFGSGTETSSAIAFDATGAAVKSAIVSGMASVSTADLDVSGPAGGPWVVTWKGSFAAIEVPEFTLDGSSLTGTNNVLVETLQQGYSGADTVYLLSTVMFSDQAGTYRLNVGGVWTGAIAYNATPATVKAALESLSSVDVGDVVVEGFVSAHALVPGHLLLVRFRGNYTGLNVTLSADWLNLVRNGTLEKLVVGGSATWPEVQLWDLGGTSGNPSGQTWRFSHEDTTEVRDGSGRVFVNVFPDPPESTWGNPVGLGGFSDPDVDYWSPDVSAIRQVYGLTSTLRVRHFVAGNGFVVVFDGGAAGVDHPLGQISTSGVSAPLARAASVVTIIDGGAGSENEVWAITVQGSGGTFTLSDGVDTTDPIALGASAATLKTRLETDLGSLTTVSVSGTGTTLDPYLVEVTDPGGTNLDALTGDGSSLTGGSGYAVESTPHNAGTDERQTLTLDPATTGGTFAITFRGQTTTPIAFDAAAATLETALEALATIGAGNVSVSGSAGGPWLIDFENALGLQDIELLVVDDSLLEGGVGNQTLAVAEVVRSRGPNHYNDPLNWTLGRVPETLDALALELSDVDLLYGIDQVREFTVDAGDDTLSIPWHSFVEGQRVRLKTSDTLPAGLTGGATDYYVLYIDHETIKLSATRGGAAIDITDAGTGTHRVGTLLASVDAIGLYTGEVGLGRYDEEGEYFEYRPRFLKTWVADAGTVRIGDGDGAGSSRLNFDFDDSQVAGRVNNTAGGLVGGVPAMLVKNENALSTWLILGGQVGYAFEREEVAEFEKITLRGGELRFGKGTVVGSIEKTGGSIHSMGATIAGVIDGWF